MPAGYVYILINPSMPKLIKIGRTQSDPEARARQLFSTGTPEPFQVAFELYSENHEALERQVHERLDAYRVAHNREFFSFPLKEAVALILKLTTPSQEQKLDYAAEDIFLRLKSKYPSYLKPQIVSARIVQTSERVWLEVTEEEEIAGYLKDQTIKRTDLAFVSDGIYDEGENEVSGLSHLPYFRRSDDVTVNAAKFVEGLDAYSIINTTELFHEAACWEINNQHHKALRDDEVP